MTNDYVQFISHYTVSAETGVSVHRPNTQHTKHVFIYFCMTEFNNA